MRPSRTLLVLASLLGLLGLQPVANAAGMEYVTVQASGAGSTATQATASALAAAVTQVNGASLASSQVSSEVLESLETASESTFASASAMAEVVTQQTKGVVRDYRILSQDQASGHWTVQIEARIAKYARSAQADRLRMAVLPFRMSRDGQQEERDRFVTELGSYLTQSRKFAMLDRRFEAERQSEMALIASTEVPMEEMAKLGNRLGTDYLVVGQIEKAAVSTHHTELVGRKLTSHTAHFAVNFQVIDAPTGQVKFADSWSRSVEGGSLAGLANQAAEAISRQIVEAIAPLAVESVAGDVLFLGQGGKSIQVGQRYRLLRRGDTVIDSYTGESLGHQEIKVGLVEVIDVQSKMAKARILEANLDVAEHFAPGKFVLRLVADAPRRLPSPASPAPASASAANSAKRVEQIKQTLEADW